MTISYDPEGQEPCLVQGFCQAIPDPAGVTEVETAFLEEPLDYRNVTTYASKLQYSCPLAKEFLINEVSGETMPLIEKNCDWEENWQPDTNIPSCVCK